MDGTEPRTAAATPPGLAAWLGPVAATVVMQTTSAMLLRMLPAIAPALMGDFGFAAPTIGYLAAMSSIGSIVFLVFGAPLIRRAGPIRALQVGLALSAIGAALLAVPVVATAVIACALIGLGYGPSPSAGSDVLQRYAPPRHRNLIFSIKQAGVPLGGVLAGLVLPALVEGFGWRAALVFGVLVSIATVLAVQALREQVDVARDRAQLVGVTAFIALDNIMRPVRALRAAPALPPLLAAGICFSLGQGVWLTYLVTSLVTNFGMSLPAAGFVFAITQVTGVFGRVLLGWVSDRLGSAVLVLKTVAILGGATTVALALATPDWPFWAHCLLAGIAGVTVTSWNGLQLAEIARAAPRSLIAETTAGATVVVFMGYVVGPSAFALLAAATGRFDIGYMVVAGFSLLGFFALRGADTRGTSARRT
jgi:MFS family permease